MEKVFRLGESESLRSELFRMKLQAHRLLGVSPRKTEGSHLVNSSVHELEEKETQNVVGSLQVAGSAEGVKESSNQHA